MVAGTSATAESAPAGGSGNGASNSRCGATSGTRPGTVEVGVDTARMLFRLRSERDQDRAREALAAPSRLLFEGGLLAQDETRLLNGRMAMGYMPGHEVVWVEGRPIEALAGCQTTALLPPGAIADAHEIVRQEVAKQYGSARPMGLSRVDVTATVALGAPADGWALLRGMKALDVPRRKTLLYERDGRPETVAKVTDRGAIRERIYDKGLERGDAPAGTRVRFEAQTRHTKATRMMAEHWTREHVQATYEQRFAPMARSADGLHIGSERVIREQLREFALDGKITPRMAELLIGHVGARAIGIPQARRTYYRRRQELRRLGLALALDGNESDHVSIDLAAVLDDVLTNASWSS